MSCETLVDIGAGAFENIGGAVDHGVEQVHQIGFAGDRRRALARELVPTSVNGLGSS